MMNVYNLELVWNNEIWNYVCIIFLVKCIYFKYDSVFICQILKFNKILCVILQIHTLWSSV